MHVERLEEMLRDKDKRIKELEVANRELEKKVEDLED